jgi:hypothetical protein
LSGFEKTCILESKLATIISEKSPQPLHHLSPTSTPKSTKFTILVLAVTRIVKNQHAKISALKFLKAL